MKIVNLDEIVKNSNLSAVGESFLSHSLERASGKLSCTEHDESCPVYYNASVCCVWPISICVPDDYEFPKLKGLVVNE
jgi:hypothetical protein